MAQGNRPFDQRYSVMNPMAREFDYCIVCGFFSTGQARLPHITKRAHFAQDTLKAYGHRGMGRPL